MEQANTPMQLVHILIDVEMLKLVRDYQARMQIDTRAATIRALVSLGLRAGVKAKREGK